MTGIVGSTNVWILQTNSFLELFVDSDFPYLAGIIRAF